ncbi:MAG: hypothetical protein P4K80_00015 [Acidobacteriaceae bacterium]|nr:hypothetical protein [Acidobacteriaceae bacterium]
MRQAFYTFCKFVLFFLTFAAGSFFPPFHLERVLAVTPDGTRIFIWDGVVLMALLFVLLLLIEALRKRIRTSGPWTGAAFVLAAVLGLAAKFGFLTRPLL